MEKSKVFISEMERRYPKGTASEARVRLIKPFEAVCVVGDGVEGIIRNRELSWGREPAHPSEILSVGQVVRVRVLGIDRVRGRLKLSLRQAERDPWENIERRYKIGKVVSCTVAHLSQKGAFLSLEPALTGFLPLHEVCSPPPDRIDDVLWVGDTIEATIVHLDYEERRLELSIRRYLFLLQHQRQALRRRKYLIDEDNGRTLISDLLSDHDRLALLSFLKEHQDNSKQGEEAKSNAHSALAGKLRRILVADDDQSFRTSLQRLLKRLGHEVEVAFSGERAMEVCSETKIDLLLIDLSFNSGMMDGLQAARNILSRNPNLPVVIITGVCSPERHGTILKEAREAGARSVLLKPIELSSLYRVMTEIAEGKNGWDVAQINDRYEGRAMPSNQLADLTTTHENVATAIRHELADLQQSTKATACVLFQMDEATREVRVFAHTGAPLSGYEVYKYDLQATPIDEVIRFGRKFYEMDTSRNPQRFQYLNLLNFASCIGVPVNSFGPIKHGLFLFHAHKGHLGEKSLEEACMVAKLLGAIIAREEAKQIIRRVQPFIFIGQVGSTLIHEVNNRLGSLLNDAEILRVDHEIIEGDLSRAMDYRLRGEMRVSIENLERNSKAMKEITNLYLGMIGAERQGLVNINELINRALNILAPVMEGNFVEVITELEDDLPSTLAVGVRLEQIFINIALNAVQHINIAHGTGELTIKSRFVKRNASLPIQVRFIDTGPGIHKQHAKHIFDLGFSTRKEGTGLGLFTTRWLVESMGGRVSVEKSIMLVGSTFLVELPLVIPSVERAGP